MLHTELGRADSVVTALEKRRPQVAGHCRRVSAYSVRLAIEFGLPGHVIETIRVGALLHDVGKLLTPARILEKPSRPNAREWQELKLHPEWGSEICHRSGFDAEVCAIVLHHHERYDGRGYPDGLAQPAIPYPVRIVSVMDTFDALTSPRDYREHLSVNGARALIARGAGSRFCPWVVSGLLALPAELLRPANAHAAEGARHPEGPAVLPPASLGRFRLTDASLLQVSSC